MYIKYLLFLIILFNNSKVTAQALITPFEKSDGANTATYEELIDYYRLLEKTYRSIQLTEAGPTDMSHPLHVVYYSSDKSFHPENASDKFTILINNGIHPGEPDGIDASMMLLRDYASGKHKLPDHIVLAVIPVFNVGGMLQRGSFSRANQNGPKSYGFRGSAQNLDLNRDFIKMDAKETRSLVKLFHSLDPDIFIDNHVSNGADYQHVMTLLTSNVLKTGQYLGTFLKNQMEPALYKEMKAKGFPMVPYVNHWGHTPDSGWQQFYDPPRFASGFAGLFQTIAFVPETHMLKPFDQRVKATYELMKSIISYASIHHEEIRNARTQERESVRQRKVFEIDWQVDTTRSSTITFLGYEAGYKPSKVSGAPRLFYDPSKPYEKMIPFYDHYLPAQKVRAPAFYVIGQGWGKVVTRLKTNGVRMYPLKQDSVIEMTVYRIMDYETGKRPYEGHYLHSKTEVTTHKETIRLLKGDYLIPTNQPARRYLIETLEPTAPDAFFSWGFFDAILQQKEYFSDYVFEDEAARLLEQDADLAERFRKRKNADPEFARDGRAQLDFIYRNSPWYEPVHLRYPVFRID